MVQYVNKLINLNQGTSIFMKRFFIASCCIFTMSTLFCISKYDNNGTRYVYSKLYEAYDAFMSPEDRQHMYDSGIHHYRGQVNSFTEALLACQEDEKYDQPDWQYKKNRCITGLIMVESFAQLLEKKDPENKQLLAELNEIKEHYIANNAHGVTHKDISDEEKSKAYYTKHSWISWTHLFPTDAVTAAYTLRHDYARSIDQEVLMLRNCFVEAETEHDFYYEASHPKVKDGLREFKKLIDIVENNPAYDEKNRALLKDFYNRIQDYSKQQPYFWIKGWDSIRVKSQEKSNK